MRSVRRLAVLAGRGLIAALGVISAATSVQALEQPTLLTSDDLRLGVAMTATETEEARQFCQETLARTAAEPEALGRACACFAAAWGARTNRLHRLVLPITIAPDAPESRRNLALILRQQGGTDGARLRQLSSEYELAARQAFRACR